MLFLCFVFAKMLSGFFAIFQHLADRSELETLFLDF